MQAAARARFDRITLGTLIGRGAQSAVYLGALDGESYAVKLALERCPAGDDRLAVSFRREAALMMKIAGPGVPELFEAGETHDLRPYLVLEYVQGETLRTRLSRGPLSEREARTLGAALCDILGRVHALGIVHRDLKPENIVISSTLDAPTILDFGLATEAGMVVGAQRGAEVAGTFAYSAPEQTGMITRSLDHRADLYALGALLYECLAGSPLFSHDDPLALLRMHLSEPVPPLKRPDVSDGCEQIIRQLLAKDADDRFASAERAADALLERSQPRARSPRLAADSPVHADALRALMARAEAAASGASETVVLSGPSGSGKSWLATTVARRLRALDVHVLRAACPPQSGAPFELFRALIEAFLSEDMRERDGSVARALMGGPLSDYAEVLADLVPGLSAWAGERPHAVSRGSAALGESALSSFVCELAGGERVLTVIAEDIERADPASLGLLRRLGELELPRTLILLSSTLSSREARERLALPTRTAFVELGSLTRAEVEKLIAVELGTNDVDPALVTQVYASSAASVASVRLYLRALIEAGALRPCWGRFSFEPALVAQLSLPADLDAAAAARVSRLAPDTVQVLSRFALRPGGVDLPMCEAMTGLSPAELSVHLGAALENGVLVAQEGRYRFAHDGTLKALLDRLSDGERRDGERRIVRALLAQPESEQRDFDLAQHGRAGDEPQTAPLIVAAACRAGSRALSLAAYETALGSFELAEAVASRHSLDLAPDALRAYAEATVELGDAPRGLALLERALAAAVDPFERAEIHLYQANVQFFSSGATFEMGRSLDAAHREIGRRLPKEGPALLVPLLLYGVAWAFVELTNLGFGRGRGDARRRLAIKTRLAEFTGLHSLFTAAPLSMLYMMAWGFWSGLALGESREYAVGSGAIAVALSAMNPKSRIGRYYRKRSVDIARRLGDRTAEANALHYEAIADLYAGRIHEAERAMVDCLRTRAPWLDARALVNFAVLLAILNVQRGYLDRAMKTLERYTRPRSRAKREHLVIWSVRLPALAILGRREELERGLREVPEVIGTPAKEPLRWLDHHAAKAWALLELGEVGPSLAALVDVAEQSPLRPEFTPWMYACAFGHLAQARYALLLAAGAEQAAQAKQKLQEALERARRAGHGHPVPTPITWVVEAGLSRIERRFEAAFELLSKSERMAHEHDCPSVLFEVRLERSRLLTDLDRTVAAEREAAAAQELAEAMGWPLRSERARALVVAARRKSSDHSRTLLHTRVRGADSSVAGTELAQASRDRAALLEVSLALTHELEPQLQAEAALDTLLSMLNADRAFMFVTDAEGLWLLAARGRDKQPADALDYAGSLVERVARERRPIVINGTEEGMLLGFQSVVAHSLRSVICAPLEIRERLVGVIYLDSRVARGMFTPADLELLVGIASHIAIGHELAMAARRDAEKRELERDLEITAAVQSLLLPEGRELLVGGFSLAAETWPAAKAGGDFFQWEPREDGGARIILGDVTGHGAGAAMVTALLTGIYRAISTPGASDSAALLAALHAHLHHVCRGRYALALSILEVAADGSATFINAGGPPLVVLRADGTVDVARAAGRPLGIDDMNPALELVDLAVGDVALLFTDGLLEMAVPEGRSLNLGKIARLLSKHGTGLTASELRSRLAEKIHELRGGVPLADDLTFCVCKRTR